MSAVCARSGLDLTRSMHFAFGAMIILTVTSPSAAYQAWRSASFGAPMITLGGKTCLGPPVIYRAFTTGENLATH